MMNSTAVRTFGSSDAQTHEDLGGDPSLFPDERQQQVLGADVVVIKPLCFILSQGQDLARPVAELVEPVHRRLPRQLVPR